MEIVWVDVDINFADRSFHVLDSKKKATSEFQK